MTDFYYDSNTHTVRRYPNDSNTGQRDFDKQKRDWVDECCQRSACQWDEKITSERAMEIIGYG